MTMTKPIIRPRPAWFVGLACLAACTASVEPADNPATQTEALDCSGFDVYSAALASHTVDCQGTIGPTSFFVDGAGRLQRGFATCPQDPGKLQSIDQLLSLQQRGDVVPHATECLAGRWAAWRAKFDDRAISACPRWRKEQTIAAPTADRIDRLVAELPAMPVAMTKAPQEAPPSEENYLFSAYYPDGAPAQDCGTPGECAAQCAGGLPGFVVSTEGAHVLADPAYWLLDTVFDPNPDPFKRPGYYHPMCYYGPPPGTIVGHRNRADEFCCYYAPDGINYILRLKLNCLDYTDETTCISLCQP